MNRSAPISKRRSSRASSHRRRRRPDRAPGASRRTPGNRASPDRAFWPLPIVTSVPPLPLLQAASSAGDREHAAAASRARAHACAAIRRVTLRLMTHWRTPDVIASQPVISLAMRALHVQTHGRCGVGAHLRRDIFRDPLTESQSALRRTLILRTSARVHRCTMRDAAHIRRRARTRVECGPRIVAARLHARAKRLGTVSAARRLAIETVTGAISRDRIVRAALSGDGRLCSDNDGGANVIRHRRTDNQVLA